MGHLLAALFVVLAAVPVCAMEVVVQVQPGLPGAGVVVQIQPARQNPAAFAEDGPSGVDTQSPGRAQPAGLPEPMAVTFSWDEYVTRVVVEQARPGKSLRAPAWVVTYDLTDHLVVAYRATAFLSKDGTLHIDARHAVLSGPKKDGWSPDSFAIAPDGTLQSIDDNPDHPGNAGTVTETVLAKEAAYKRLLMIAMAIVREAS